MAQFSDTPLPAYNEGRATSGRATTIEAYRSIVQGLTTKEGVSKGLSVRLRPTDVVVAPYSKSGTTWLQQIAHCLRTRGDMEFDDISRVAPWLETSTDLGLDLNAEQSANPRVFKSHLDANRIPTGARYIISCRDPRDVAYSLFKFMEGWFIEPGSVTLEDFIQNSFMVKGGAGIDYWDHLSSWWERRNDPDVLFMAYEHMKEDLGGTIERVASFMDIALDDELFAITHTHASLGFMKEHKDKFDDLLMREHSANVAGMPVDSETSKVRAGQVGDSRGSMGVEVWAKFDDIWRERITGPLGFADYAAMIATL